MRSSKRARTPRCVIHPLTDHRRELPLEKKGELVNAHPDFQLVISYNPGYQSLMKDLKQSTKQRFGALDFDYPERRNRNRDRGHEGGVDAGDGRQAGADRAACAQPEGSRPGRGHFDAPAGLRGQLIAKGVEPVAPASMALVTPLTDDPDMRDTLDAAVKTFFG